ncbi:hypothetical protein ACHAP5_007745 [Fusarium lateritium]
MPETTAVDLPDISHWLCKKNTQSTADTPCNTTNKISDKKCTKCTGEREIGSIAQDKNKKDIGQLTSKDRNGSELWEYFKYFE